MNPVAVLVSSLPASARATQSIDLSGEGADLLFQLILGPLASVVVTQKRQVDDSGLQDRSPDTLGGDGRGWGLAPFPRADGHQAPQP